MDSDRRHQLAKNQLREWIFQLYEDLYKPYSNYFLFGLGIAIIAVCITVVGSNLLQDQKAKQWGDYFDALAVADADARMQQLEEYAKAYRSGAIGLQIRLTIAQTRLREGSQLLYTEREKAKEALETALTYFNEADRIASTARQKSEIRYGLGATYESLAATRTDKDDLLQAEKNYREAFENWPDTPAAGLAKAAYRQIHRPESKQLYAMLAAAPQEKPAPLNIDLKKGETIGGPTEFDPMKALSE